LLGFREIWLGGIDSKFIEVFIESSSLKLGQVERYWLGVVGVLS
jgi:hypothetical protein